MSKTKLRMTLGRAVGGHFVRVDFDDPRPMTEDEALDLMPLLRAAPKMLEALGVARRYVHDALGDGAPLVEAIDAVLVKARGES